MLGVSNEEQSARDNNRICEYDSNCFLSFAVPHQPTTARASNITEVSAASLRTWAVVLTLYQPRPCDCSRRQTVTSSWIHVTRFRYVMFISHGRWCPVVTYSDVYKNKRKLNKLVFNGEPSITICLRWKSAFDLAFDLRPCKASQQYPLAWWIFLPSFTEILNSSSIG